MKHLDDLFDYWMNDWLISLGIPENMSLYIALVLNLLILFLICAVAFWIAKKVVIKILSTVIKKTKYTWDNRIFNKQIFNPLAHIIPAFLIRAFIPYIFDDFPDLVPFLIKLTDIYIIFAIVKAINAFLNSVRDLTKDSAYFKDKPIDSYFQLVKIIIYIIVGILVLSIFIDKSPIYLLTAFGAMSAVILLIFKDTILGFVASVQVAANDMVRIGDWIQMDQFGADGTVLTISLNTVKVQNFDNTIITIPTYKFISESFKNWRGMSESGGRRIKRSVDININSIKYCTDEMLKEYGKIEFMKDYIAERQSEIEEFNKNNNIDKSELVNGRNLTNIGLFRYYLESYLKHNDNISKDFTLMVRQLTPNEKGLPLELYTFTNTTDWIKYEGIQSDVFDHVLAAAREFDLEVFQYPSGMDIANIKMNVKEN